MRQYHGRNRRKISYTKVFSTQCNATRKMYKNSSKNGFILKNLVYALLHTKQLNTETIEYL